MDRPGEETLIRYFLGKCSPEEEKVIHAYLALKIDQDYVEACLREAFYLQEVQYTPADSQQDRDRVWHKLVSKQQDPSVTRFKPRRRWYGYAAAAIAFFVLSAGLVFLFNGNWMNGQQEQIAWQQVQGETGRPKTVTLADSSMVTLFPGSTIDIPSNFNEADRKVNLTGRAFFAVAPNKRKPFYVAAGGLTTQVLGTSFEVDDAETESRITLHTGAISVLRSDKEVARLIPNQQITYQQATGTYQVDAVDAASTLNWLDGELDYDRVPLQRIIADIEKWYGVDIQVAEPSLLEQKVIFSFKDQPLSRVLSLLSKSADFSYEINGKQVILF